MMSKKIDDVDDWANVLCKFMNGEPENVIGGKIVRITMLTGQSYIGCGCEMRIGSGVHVSCVPGWFYLKPCDYFESCFRFTDLPGFESATCKVVRGSGVHLNIAAVVSIEEVHVEVEEHVD